MQRLTFLKRLMLSLLRSLQLIQRQRLLGLFRGIINPMLCGMGPDALVEFIHSPLFFSHFASMQIQCKRQQSGSSPGVLMHSNGFKLGLCGSNYTCCFQSKLGPVVSSQGSAPPSPHACSLFMTSCPFNPTLIYASIESTFLGLNKHVLLLLTSPGDKVSVSGEK